MKPRLRRAAKQTIDDRTMVEAAERLITALGRNRKAAERTATTPPQLPATIGRPRSPLEERIQVRLTRDQRAAWTALAGAEGMDLGAFLRAGAELLAAQISTSSTTSSKTKGNAS